MALVSQDAMPVLRTFIGAGQRYLETGQIASYQITYKDGAVHAYFNPACKRKLVVHVVGYTDPRRKRIAVNSRLRDGALITNNEMRNGLPYPDEEHRSDLPQRASGEISYSFFDLVELLSDSFDCLG